MSRPTDVSTSVRRQYERFPYPPIARLALPRRGQGEELSFGFGTRLAFGEARKAEGIRVLVAGCGTFEPVVVAGAHPEAAEVVAVDLSGASLRVLGQRLALARWVGRRKLPPVTRVRADLMEWEPGAGFDYILASNLLQHVPEPGKMLARLASWLRPGGLLRAVVYPRQSRIWMRETARWLHWHGITPETPHLRRRARAAIARLPADHPIRLTFETQPETGTEAGLVDAFLNAWEQPPSPLDWSTAAAAAGLRLAGESQTETSRSGFLDEIVPEIGTLGWSGWQKLQGLDDMLELCANPVLWFVRGDGEPVPSPETLAPDSWKWSGEADFTLPSPVRFEIAEGLRRLESALAGRVSLGEVRRRFAEGVGPRVSAPPAERPLPGLAIVDYDWQELMTIPRPCLAGLPAGARLRPRGSAAWETEVELALKGETDLVRQAEWITLRFGAAMSWIPVRIA